jgi:N-acetylglucosaminyl-diphospho-decaprenol L-rhamnosyltransferase
MMVDVSIIIVSWNVADLLVTCLRSLQAGQGAYTQEIIVVDSASTDDTVHRISLEFPDAILLPQTENLGFSRCNNIGLAAASGRHLLLLNPDTEVIGGAVGQMVAYLDAHPQIGIVGPHTLNTDLTTQSTRRRFPTVSLAFFESTWLQPFTPKAWLDRYYVVDLPDSDVFEIDWVQGSALMARREVYQQIGGLDEQYVMFFEELDWCKRAKNAGWRVAYFGTAQIVHHGGKSTDQVVARKHIYFQRSKLHYFAKHHGMIIALSLRLFLLVSYVVQIAIEGVKTLLGSKRSMRRDRIVAYWQVLRSGLRIENTSG